MTEHGTTMNTVTEALTVNAGVETVTATLTATLPSLSSSSGVSSSSPTSSSFGSNGGGALEVQGNNGPQDLTPHTDSVQSGDTDGDDSVSNVNTASTVTTTSSNNQCNSSGERVGADGDRRGSPDDIISHLNMLSMQDGLGFNGCGLLGTGTGNAGNGWTPPTVASNVNFPGNGYSKPPFNHMQEQQQISIVNYIEALKLQQQLQLQQLKHGALASDVAPNFFPLPNAAPNLFGGAALPMQQAQHFRRPIFGYGNYAGHENMHGGIHGSFLTNRPGGIHFPHLETGSGNGRGKMFPQNNSLGGLEAIRAGNYIERRTPAMNQQQTLPTSLTTSYLNGRNHFNGGSLINSPSLDGSRTKFTSNAPFGGGARFDQCRDVASQQALQQCFRQKRAIQSSVCSQYPSWNRAVTPGSTHNPAMSSGLRGAAEVAPASKATAQFSRKVFIGGLPPDIDEAVFKRPFSAMKCPESIATPASIPSSTPSGVNVLLIPSNVAVSGMIPSPAPAGIAAQAGCSPAYVRSNSSINGQEIFSRKVFVGGLPMDISEEEICATFIRFGSLVVDWPHKVESKSYFPPKGYAFLIFHHESSVPLLIEHCIQQDGRYYICVSSPTMREKAVQIRPWRLTDADYVLDPSLPLDPRKTVFVGGVPRPLKAVELASILDRLFNGVCYTGIDTDPELKYPKGAGRVSFSNQQSYIAAISARFVQLHHGDIDKRVEIKPYVLDDQMCDECGGARCGGKFAPFFCANVSCLQYFCEMCWQQIHSKAGREFHKPLVKEGSDRPRAVPFKWNTMHE